MRDFEYANLKYACNAFLENTAIPDKIYYANSLSPRRCLFNV